MNLGRLSTVLAGMTVATVIEVLHVVSPAAAVSLTGLDARNNLLFFDSSTPKTVSRKVAVTGLQFGESLLGIDYRPATGDLFGIGSSNLVYKIDPATGRAIPVSPTPFSPGLSGTAFDIDFNPVPDLIRVVSNSGQNLRISPVTGAQAANSPDAALRYADGDVNVGKAANIVAAAYANNIAGVPSTTLYGIDSVLNVLVRQGGLNFPVNPPSPNLGQLFTVGALGVDFDSLTGFDIFTANGVDLAFATSDANLYSINLNTGAATLIDSIGDGTGVTDVAASAVPEPTTIAGVLASSSIFAALRRRRTKASN